MINSINKEKRVLNIIRFGAIALVLLFSTIITSILIKHQNENLEVDIQNIEESFISSNKIKVENLVKNIHNFIETEKRIEEDRLNARLKEEVYQAYAMATAIYNETKDDPNFSKEKTIKLIKEAIRNVRFNDDIGYMFIYTMDGKNILNAQFPQFEGTNFWDFKDAKGAPLIQEMNQLLSLNNETFYEWYWWKTKKNETQYKKFGFFKKFEPLDLFIGTGDYVDEI